MPRPSLIVCGGGFDLAGKEKRIAEIETSICAPNAWDDQPKMTLLLKEKSRLEAEVLQYKSLQNSYYDMQEWLALTVEFKAEEKLVPQGQNFAKPNMASDGLGNLAKQDAEDRASEIFTASSGTQASVSFNEEEEILVALEEAVNVLKSLLVTTEMEILLADEADHMDAILDIHPGAGGTEAQDWAAMLERMYMRFADTKKFKLEILDYLAGEEAGTKSITMRIQGANAFGLLRGEKGIHRLIRISPFDSSGRRHTSFASVDVIPDAGDEINIVIKDEDLRLDFYRASGAGGQHVNKTESAVRITHIPTGIVAQCQNEKSQHSNKESAMRILKARLYEHERSKRDALRQADYQDKDLISFGSQIRTYTMHPYRLVKDHRTQCEAGDVDGVLDGKIDAFVRDFLLYSHEKRV